MTGFSAEWLALRAPADDAARDLALVEALEQWADGRPLTITDIGGGSGAAYRALSPRLPSAKWRVLDDDPALLNLLPEDAVGVETNLAASTDAIFDPTPDLITAFAFIDLVSEKWLEAFAARAAASSAAIYAPLTYDGREIWRPEPPHEAKALAAFNEDMRRDKGFGPALGAKAASRLAKLLEGYGYDVHTAQSDWRLTQGPLLTALAIGSADAVVSHLSPDDHKDWSTARANAAEAIIGHIDVIAVPRA